MSLTLKQSRLLASIPPEGVSARQACENAEVGRTVLAALVRKGLAKCGMPPAVKEGFDLDALEGERRSWPVLSAEQLSAIEALEQALRSPGPARRQLWGVTGAGKTEVYLRLIDQVVSAGHGVVLLVPEIALTPMMVQRVRERFGDTVGVLHSGLTTAQRRDQYRRIAWGEARVVVGARSALFAPVQDLRLVIIDESHDSSYKQEEMPHYLARTVAEMRLEANGGLLLEGSASPAVEGVAVRSECVRMMERVRGELPVCEVVEMRNRSHKGMLAGETREALAQTVRRGEQAIVLLNRRGYSGHVHCESCGHVMMCDHCELSLTYHDQSKRLVCHHCGRSYRQPSVCPTCEEVPLVRGVPGTEKLTEELGKIVSPDKVFRLDSDVLTSGSRVQGVLEGFSRCHPGILVGTQMVAKGHDFPDVTLAVVADADTGLYVPDFRASERTFQMLTQVSGRAGRADMPGRVLVQTWNPDVPCIRMALDREDEAFYVREASIRKRLGYPPFTQLVRLMMEGNQPHRTQMAAEHLAERLKRHFAASEVRGPVRLLALRGRSRWHVVIASVDGERARGIVTQAIGQLSGPYGSRGVSLTADVDPYSFV